MAETYFVTGGNGYIGSHMCQYLVEAGHEVIVIDSGITSPAKPTHSWGEFFFYDISDPKVLSLLKTKRPKALFHFAARALVPEGEANPFLYYEENLHKTLKLIDYCCQAQLKTFVFSSTCATFGLPKTETLAENHPQSPVNTYGNTKLLIELALKDLSEKGLIQALVFRYFNAAGCDPEGQIGELHEPETHLIPNLCRAALSSSEQEFKIFGDDYPTPDGTCIRDYIHVCDLVRAHFEALSYLKDQPFEDFNLGSGSGHSVKEVAKIFEETLNLKLEKTTHPARQGDPPKLVANSEKAKKAFSFDLKYNLQDCINHTYHFLQSRL